MKRIVTTLVIIHQHPKILLGMKKRGFGAGRWNGFGGKLLEGETLEDSAHREMKEESGVTLNNLEKVGIIEFEFPHRDEVIENYFYRSDDFSGEPRETEEMRPEWFHIDEIPFTDMWPDDVYWMPLFLKGKKFKGRFVFGESDVILEKELEQVETI